MNSSAFLFVGAKIQRHITIQRQKQRESHRYLQIFANNLRQLYAILMTVETLAG